MPMSMSMSMSMRRHAHGGAPHGYGRPPLLPPLPASRPAEDSILTMCVWAHMGMDMDMDMDMGMDMNMRTRT